MDQQRRRQPQQLKSRLISVITFPPSTPLHPPGNASAIPIVMSVELPETDHLHDLVASSAIQKENRRRRQHEHIVSLYQQVIQAATVASSAVPSLLHRGRTDYVRRFRGRLPGTRNVERGACTWISEYLSDSPLYSLRQFRQKFRVPRSLFSKVHDDLVAAYPTVFGQRRDATGRAGHPSQVKILTALRILGNDRSLNDKDDANPMGTETARKIVRSFCRCVVELYTPDYLKKRPSPDDLTKIAQSFNSVGFSGCIGCIGRSKLIWKNCPFALKGQFHNSENGNLATIPVEAWCDRDLFVWHWYAGRSSSLGEGSIVDRSPLFNDIMVGHFDLRFPEPFRIDGSDTFRNIPYFLVDSAYPEWPIFSKPVDCPLNDDEAVYSRLHHAVHKHIDHCLSALQGRFRVLQSESNLWYLEDVVSQSQACVILHNMIVSMNRNGDFAEDLSEEDPLFDIVTELRDETASSADGGETNDFDLSALADADLGTNEQEHSFAPPANLAVAVSDPFLIRHSQFTSKQKSRSLEQDLIKRARILASRISISLPHPNDSEQVQNSTFSEEEGEHTRSNGFSDPTADVPRHSSYQEPLPTQARTPLPYHDPIPGGGTPRTTTFQIHEHVRTVPFPDAAQDHARAPMYNEPIPDQSRSLSFAEVISDATRTNPYDAEHPHVRNATFPDHISHHPRALAYHSDATPHHSRSMPYPE